MVTKEKKSDVKVIDSNTELEEAIGAIQNFAKANLKRDVHTEGINSGEYKITYKNPDAFNKAMLAAVQDMYGKVSAIKNITDMLGDFAANGIAITHKSRSVQKFFNEWAKYVKMISRTNTFMTELYKSSNVIIYRLEDSLKTMMKDSNKSIKIPVGYRTINPRAIDIEGDDLLGTRKYFLINSSINLSSRTRSGSSSSSLSNESTDREFARYIIKEGGFKKDQGRIRLDNSKISVMQYKKSDWDRWAIPMLYPTVHDVNFKLKLREMDKAAMDSVINVITLFKIGSDTYPATRKLFKKLASIISSSQPSLNLMWDNNLDISHVHLPVDQILGPEKYEDINQDILSGLGVPEILVNGNGANFSNSFLQVKTVVEKLKTGQAISIEFWEKETAYVSDQLGFRTYPEVRIDTMSLRDEVQEKKVVTGIYDRGAMSMETLLRYFDEDFEVEVERIKRENELEKQGIITRRGPYKKEQGAKGTPGEGRPGLDGVPQEGVRETTPTGMSSANYTEGPAKLDRCISSVKRDLISEYKKKTGKNPGPEAIKSIEQKAWAICVKSVMGDLEQIAPSDCC